MDAALRLPTLAHPGSAGLENLAALRNDDTRPVLLDAELTEHCFRHPLITEPIEMNAIFREALVLGAGHERVEKFDEAVAALLRDFADPRGGALQPTILLRGIRHRRAERLVPRRREQNEFGPTLFESSQQHLVTFLKLFET